MCLYKPNQPDTKMKNCYLAADFGGGSGRVIAGYIENSELKLEEIYRFPNRQIKLGKHVYWDFPALFEEMQTGLRTAVEKGFHVRSIGIDTWGVDFGLIDKADNLIALPRCYRDPSTTGLPEKLFADTDELTAHYAVNGIQMMPINSLFQLYVMKEENAALLNAADRLLFMPDLFSFFLTGKANNEYCIASTSELLDATKKDWHRPTLERLGLPAHLFGEIVMPGTSRGKISASVAQYTGLDKDTEVIAVGSHDTASAVFAVPETEGKRCAFLSSGTWSLLGVAVDRPILSEEARLAGFTNEGGVGGKIRFLQNITGLWILQRLMQEWAAKGYDTSYATLLSDAENATFDTIIDVDDPRFTNPDNMEKAISDYCAATGQAVPSTRGEVVLCVLKSLANRYKKGIEQLNRLLPEPIEQLNIIGGGSHNALLNRLTEEATGIPVVAGPVEATAIGNILVQALASGEIKSTSEVRTLHR